MRLIPKFTFALGGNMAFYVVGRRRTGWVGSFAVDMGIASLQLGG